jgi:predicted alpha/beta-hydrolase family hydrolase
MGHPFMTAIAVGLAERGIATLRYQFPFMEARSRRPDPPALAKRTVRSAVRVAHELMPTLPLFAGGKSFGGRMTSQAQAESPLAHVQGLCFFGFPLHPPKKPSTARAEHLAKVTIPMLFLQGTRDALADLSLMRSVIGTLPAQATLKLLRDADHAFNVLVRSGRSHAEVLQDILETVRDWCAAVNRSAN